MPVATVSVLVLARSQLEITRTLRPRDSGTQRAPYPQPSSRLAKSAAAAAVIPSIEAQTPSRPSPITLPPRQSARCTSRDAAPATSYHRTACYRGPEEDAMDKTLIVNAMIFDGSGAAPFSGDVLVEWIGNMNALRLRAPLAWVPSP